MEVDENVTSDVLAVIMNSQLPHQSEGNARQGPRRV
jgi:hypothetical protein